jgi:hypothetical protein
MASQFVPSEIGKEYNQEDVGKEVRYISIKQEQQVPPYCRAEDAHSNRQCHLSY